MPEKTDTPLFCHLHNHSEYSLLDGASSISGLVKKAKSLGHEALALTDHGNMFGAVEFYSACKQAGLHPVLGCEIFHEGLKSTEEALAKERLKPGLDAYHLVLLAKSNTGYHTLMRVVSYGQFHIKNEVPLVKESDLDGNSEGLIALSGCLRGEFGQLLLELTRRSKDPIGALKAPDASCKEVVLALQQHVAAMKKRFGTDGYNIELTDNGLAVQKAMLGILYEAAQFFGLSVVATCDSHYLESDFAEAHAVLTAVKNDLTMSKIRHRDQVARFHVLDNHEMAERFSAYEGALENTLHIARQCEVELVFGKFFLPDFDLQGEDINDALRRISKEGLEQRFEVLDKQYGSGFDEKAKEVYWQRLDYELGVIINMGFPGYFLIVQDFINWAKDHDIPVGPGRGSGAGSLVAYALKITDLDPIPLNLIFERFLNPERISMPDFEVDFCQSRRDEVIGYVNQKYGAQNVAQIVTFGKMKAKAALRDVGRVLEISYPKVDRIAKLIPNELDITLTDALKQEPRLMEEAGNDPSIDKMIRIALQVEGLSRHTSIHAAGVVISNGNMENFVPVLKSDDGVLVTQYEMKNAEKVGLVKFDFLGLKTLTVVKKAVDIINLKAKTPFDIETINLEDPLVYREISAGNTCGIFQLESSGMRALNLKLKPSCFEDIIAVVALFRPGPLGSGMVDDFIERKHGRQEIVYDLPDLEPILADTYGIILYQEQVQKIAAKLANYSLGEADILRRAMGKKKPEEMAKQKARFISGALENKIDEKIADEIFELMAKFAAYGFNKSHSAAYGLVSYQTAFLKTHYPAEFMAAIMTCDMDNTDKIVRYIEDCRRMKFTIKPPHINESDLEFSVPLPGTICYALTAIKGIGVGPLEPIIAERNKRGPYKNLTDLAKRVNLQKVGKKTLELLNEAGALSDFASKDAILQVIAEMVKFSENHHSAKAIGQGHLFEEDADEDSGVKADWEESLGEKGVMMTPLQWLLKEQKLLGVFLTGHPNLLFQKDVKKFGRLKLGHLEKLVGQRNQPLVCFLSGSSVRLTKSGKKMAYLMLEDETGSCEAVMFEGDLPEELPKDGSMLVCYGSVKKSFDGSSINLRIEKISLLETVRTELIKNVLLKVRLSGTSPESARQFLNTLYKTTSENPGKTPFKILLSLDKVDIKIRPEQTGINLSNECYQILNSYPQERLELVAQ